MKRKARVACVIIGILVGLLAGCVTAPSAAEHAARLSETVISLDDYELVESTTRVLQSWSTYRLKSSAGAATDGPAFIAAVAAIWEELPDINDLVASYGLPPKVLIADGPNGSHLTFIYETGSLYFGPDSDSVIEIRFSEGEQAGFTYLGVGIGSPLDEVTSAFGAPVDTIRGDIEWVDQVLYLRPRGGGYLRYNDQGVRFFFDGRTETSLTVTGMYLFEPELRPDSPTRTAGAANRIYFRSSEIEFWSINSLADIGDLVSSKYVGAPDYAANHSLEYRLSNAPESVVFNLDGEVRQSISRPDLNPGWESMVSNLLAAGMASINVIRLDIGGGYVTVVIDGEERQVYAADGAAASGIDGNSIFFVDQALFSGPVLVTRQIVQEIINGTATADTLGISETDFEVVSALHTSSNWADSEGTPIDVNGALILPMSPVDLTGFRPATETLDIVIAWDGANAVQVRDGKYVIDDAVGVILFDFDVRVVRGPK